MKILVEELITELEQGFRIVDGKVHHWKGVRPYLYAHNNPVGTFTMELISNGSTLASSTFTALDLYSALDTTDDFIHLVYRLNFNKVLPLKNGVYSLKLTSSGYVYNYNCFLGWVKEFENLKFPTYMIPPDDSSNPLTFEPWSFE